MIQLSPLEAAVTTVLSQDPSLSQQVRTEAQQFCDGEIQVLVLFISFQLSRVSFPLLRFFLVAFQNRSDGWRISCQQFLLRSKFPDEILASASSASQLNDWLIEPRFWYAQVIADSVLSLNCNDRASVRTFLFMYLDDILPWRVVTLSKSTRQQQGESHQTRIMLPTALLAPDNSAVLAKVALTYVRCLLADYPEKWSEGITALLELWSKHRNRYNSEATASINGKVLNGALEHSLTKSAETSYRQSPAAVIALQQYAMMTQFFFSVMEAFDDEVVAETVVRPQATRDRNMKVRKRCSASFCTTFFFFSGEGRLTRR